MPSVNFGREENIFKKYWCPLCKILMLKIVAVNGGLKQNKSFQYNNCYKILLAYLEHYVTSNELQVADKILQIKDLSC